GSLDRHGGMNAINKTLRRYVLVSAALVAGLGIYHVARGNSAMSKTGHASVNQLRYYYEIRGEGPPLLLLHGGLGTHDMFAPILPALGDGRQLILVDLQGHGRTPLGDREMSLPAMSDDMAALLDQLGYHQVDVLGYSLGGGVAFRLAVQHPDR